MKGATRERWQRIVAGVAVIALVVVAVRVGSSDSASVRFSETGEWLETGVTGSVVLVSGATGEVISRATVAEPGNSLSAVTSDGAALVLDRNGSMVSLLSGATQEITRSLDTEPGGNQLDLLGNDEVVYLVQPSSIRVLDPATLAVLDDVEIDGFPGERVVDEAGRLWTYSRETGTLHNVSVTNDSSRRVALNSKLVASGRDALLLSAGDGSFSLSQASGGSLVSCSTDAELDDLVAGSDGQFAFVAKSDGSTTWVIDLASPRCDETIEMDGDVNFSVAAAEDGFGYAGDIGTGAVASFDLRERNLRGQDRFSVQNVGFDLYALNGVVWANEPTGARAAIFDDGELKAAVDKVGFADSVGSDSGDATGQGGLVDADDSTLDLLSALEGAESDGNVDVAGEQLLAGDVPNAPSEPDPEGSLRANFTYSSPIAFVGEPITFNDRSSGAPTSFSWDFGDGELGSGPEVSHSWEAEGEYLVQLVVEDGETSDSASATVTIVSEDTSGPPIANFKASDSTVEIGQSVVFTDASVGSPSAFAWDFGDGTKGTGSSVTKAWSKAGTYTVKLAVRNVYGSDSTQRSITVLGDAAPPSVAITLAPSSLAAGQFGSFVASTQGSPTTIEWDFGDGTTEEGASVSHSWSSPGTYSVTVRVSNSLGSGSDRVSVAVGNALAPVAQFSISATTVAAGEQINVVSTSLNAPTSTTWDFGDGRSASGTSATHVYNNPGSFTVTLTVENAAGTDSTDKAVTVTAANPTPVAAFSFSPANPAVGTAVSFTDRSQNGPTDWRWTFGDGASSSAQNASHTFTSAGRYRVTLTATNGTGSDTNTQVIIVDVAAPIADFAVTPNPAIAGQAVSFADLSGGAPTGWRWAFGDGFTSTEQNPTHTFAQGIYRVTLTAVNAGGENTRSRRVVVGPALPVAAFSITPQNPKVDQPVSFQNNSTGGDSYLWDFGGGETSTLRDPAPRTYNQPGPKSVTLTVTNASGPSSVTQNFTVSVPAPVASFTISPGPYVVGQPITFTSTSTGQINSYQWTFGALGTASGPQATYTFNLTGAKTITLTVNGPGGPPSTVSQVITVVAPAPVANFSWSANPTAGVAVQFTNLSTNATSYVWTFGDGTPPATGVNPPHTFATAGTYTVTLIAIGPSGTTSQRSLLVQVAAPAPVANFSWSANPTAGVAVQFTNLSTNATSYVWTFGDGTPPATGVNPPHTFTTAGTYNVTLTASGPGGSNPITRMVIVGP